VDAEKKIVKLFEEIFQSSPVAAAKRDFNAALHRHGVIAIGVAA